ncbi:TVAZ2 protein, partial [Pluvianellus socialis]|nr:TVAZ2 protein [Pluvianellus socialis]
YILGRVVAAGRAQVHQDLLAETTESTGIDITCSYPDIQSTEIIHWYRQLPGQRPMFLVSTHKGTEELPDPPGQLSVAANRQSSALWLAWSQQGDTVVYYCALGD